MIRFAVAALGVAAVCAPAQTPSPDEQSRFLEMARRVALNYSDTLPDFVCTEVVHRSWNDTGQWRSLDTITAQLSYFQKKENYKLILPGNKLSDMPLETYGGAMSLGEFGSTLRWIFEPESQTEFHWQQAADVHKTRVSVYGYRVRRDRSRFALLFGAGNERRSIVVGYHGSVHIANDTYMVLRLTREADAVPSDFPIQQSSINVEYDFAEVGGRRFLLPSQSETMMLYRPNRGTVKQPIRVLRPAQFRNLVYFRSYRKFAVDSEIKFGEDGKP